MKLTHIDDDGRPRMVDVAAKDDTVRVATAEGQIRMSHEAFELVKGGGGPKGNVETTAELAGTMGAKLTSSLIPLCHPVGLDNVKVAVELDETLPGVRVEATAKVVGKTGVEMEALTAVSVALLTVYDMTKSTGHAMEIGRIRLLRKTGGQSGDWELNG